MREVVTVGAHIFSLEPVYQCTECVRSFPEEDRLEQHINDKHTESNDDWDDELEPMQVEHVHTINVIHTQVKEVHHIAPRKSSPRIVSMAGSCLEDPESSAAERSLSASILSVKQGHDDPAYKSGGTYVVEEYVDENYDSDDDKCDCGNIPATDCANYSCGDCCPGDCKRHG